MRLSGILAWVSNFTTGISPTCFHRIFSRRIGIWGLKRSGRRSSTVAGIALTSPHHGIQCWNIQGKEDSPKRQTVTSTVMLASKNKSGVCPLECPLLCKLMNSFS
ncbi:unnamed protein product [Nesidiocoris tenuis]|uniref:Uncharacterized protein n=1 Tax=Nesidiocoris tenuis TaxID=355587 RepID=A0A6H5GZG5_9HEMI|nr:unnamed protein product [Nesidiocoris tenuis]